MEESGVGEGRELKLLLVLQCFDFGTPLDESEA